jgi:hypothetical protein
MANQVPNSAKVMYRKGQIKDSDMAGTGSADTFKMILLAPGFVFDKDNHNSYADVIAFEVPNGNGYTTGGITLTGVTCVVDDTADQAKTSWSNVQWNASAGSISASGAIIFDDTTDGVTSDYADAIISYKDALGTITATDGTPIIFSSIKETFS